MGLDSSSEEELPYDSSDQDEPAPALPKRVQRKKPQFDSAAVLRAVLGSAKTSGSAEVKGVKQHVPAFFGRDIEDRWEAWSQRTPNHLSEVPAEQQQRCLMPGRCLPADAPVEQVARVQAELITYSNTAGRRVVRTQMQRDNDANKPLVDGDITVGSTVAFKREEGATTGVPGWNTPFYIGDVLSIELEPEPASSSGSSSPRPARAITIVRVHHRMPRYGCKHCDDVLRPWMLVCNGGESHPWTAACDLRTNLCVPAKLKGKEDAAKMTDLVDACAIFETALDLTATGALRQGTKERLAEHGPPGSSWHDLLKVGPKQPPRKKRGRKQ